MKMDIKSDIVDESEMTPVRPENRYEGLLKKLDQVKEGKVLRILKKSLNLKNPRAGMYGLIRRKTTFQVVISQNKDFVYIKKIK